MDVSMIAALTGATKNLSKSANATGLDMANTGMAADGTMFDAMFNSALNNINQTNSYLSEAENQEILFALGETDSTHDLMIALNKASTALQYTVAIRDKVLEAYKSLIQMQI